MSEFLDDFLRVKILLIRAICEIRGLTFLRVIINIVIRTKASIVHTLSFILSNPIFFYLATE